MTGHGYIYWNELMTRDVERAKAFYGWLIGWTFQAMPMSGGNYWLFMPDGADRPAGGMMQMAGDPDMPTDVWFTYVAVSDLDHRLGEVAAAGGVVVRPAFEVPGVGRVAVVRDPTGALIGWISPVEVG